MTYKPYIFNQPIANLGARIVLMGDTALAHSHVLDAKKFLAEVRQGQGINVAVENGQISWHAMSRILPDGTRIRVQHEPGFDTITIESPSKEKRNFLEQDKKHEEGELFNFMPWLWVGIRHVSGGYINYYDYSGFGASEMAEYIASDDPGRVARPHLCVWEPTGPDDTFKDGTPYRIISNRDQLYRPYYSELEATNGVNDVWYPLGPNRLVYGIDSDENPDDERITLTVRDGTTRPERFPGDNAWMQGEPFYDSEDGEEPNEYAWDVVIKSVKPGKARVGKHYIKVAITGWDSVPISDSEFILKVQVGYPVGLTSTVEYKIKQSMPNYTSMRQSTIPYGFFYTRNRRGRTVYDDWYFEIFWVIHPPIIDRGTNFHGDNWWQGGVFVDMPMELWQASFRMMPVVEVIDEELPNKNHEYPFIPPTGFTVQGHNSLSNQEPMYPRGSDAPAETLADFPTDQGFPEHRFRSPTKSSTTFIYYKLVLAVNVATQRIEMQGYWKNTEACYRPDDPGMFSLDPFAGNQTMVISWSGLNGMADQVVSFRSIRSGRQIDFVVAGGAYSTNIGPHVPIGSAGASFATTAEPCMGGHIGVIPPDGSDLEAISLIDPFYAVVEVTNVQIAPPDGVAWMEGGVTGRYLGGAEAWPGPGGLTEYQWSTGEYSETQLILELGNIYF